MSPITAEDSNRETTATNDIDLLIIGEVTAKPHMDVMGGRA